MPSLVDVVGVIEDDEALDLGPCEEATDAASGLPSQDAKPSDDVRKLFLIPPGCKFGYPVVLTA